MKSIEKINADIIKLKSKISNDQARLRELEKQKTGLENAEIIALVRGVAVTPSELGELIKNIYKNREDTDYEV